MAAGVQLLKEDPTNGYGREPKPYRRTTQEAIAVIMAQFRVTRVWTPARLKQATGLTHYQIKAALRQLVAAGVLVKAGSTQAVRYQLKEKEEADARTS